MLEEDGGQVRKSQARRTTDGKLLWSSDVLYTILAASSDTLYAVLSQMPGHSLIALNKLNGVKRWEFTEPTAGFVAAAVDSGGLYLCDQNAFPPPGYTPGTVYALGPNTGALHWKTTPQPGRCGKLAIGHTIVYSQVFQGIVALRQTDGSIAWQSSYKMAGGYWPQTPPPICSMRPRSWTFPLTRYRCRCRCFLRSMPKCSYTPLARLTAQPIGVFLLGRC